MVNAPVATPAAVNAPAIIKDLKGLKLADDVVEAPKEEAKLDIDTLLHSTDAAKRTAAANELVAILKLEGPQAFVRFGLADAIANGIADKSKTGAPREAACQLLSTMFTAGVGQAAEPFVFEKLIPALVGELLADKVKSVQTAALAALKTIVGVMTPWAVPTLLLPTLLKEIKTAGKWQVKTGSLEILELLVQRAPRQLAKCMPDIIPVMAEAIWDTKADVKKAARAALTNVCQLVSNKDIEKFIPALISCLGNPEEVTQTISLLAATTFVSEVDSPTLSLMAPLLQRGLNERLTATRRKVAVIIDNMAKLVDNERTVRPFLPKLLPGLIKLEGQVADPEARGVVVRAIKTLQEVGKVEGDGSSAEPLSMVETAKVAKSTAAAVKKAVPSNTAGTNADAPLVQFIGELGACLANANEYDPTEWEHALVPYISLALGDDVAPAQGIARDILDKTASATGEEVLTFDDEEEGEDLCNCTFSLAYGAKILLNTATLRLKRGHRYGLCGRNGSGKSTLMTAIVKGQVEGFPSPEEVRTWYVAHDLDGSEGEMSCVEFILQDSRLSVQEAEVREQLTEMGFNTDRQNYPIAGLSGGWKMKLALARAMLFKADILLLDEPTNHMDVVNVAWLENYLKGLERCTSIIVSHDSGFLNNVTTDILHLNRFKVKRYPGNLQAFVKMVPEAKSYYELAPAEDYQFKLPNPPLLEGVKTKEKSIMKMRKVAFQYPGSPAPQLNDITLQVSLSSRVAVLGPNGSGKSTLVKLLVGETEPNLGGEVWKHPNLVIGYVAQHAFHHIDNHLDKTPLEYLLQRYSTGEDLEELTKANRTITEEEQQKMKEGANMVIEGQKRIIDEIVARKKLKQSYEYEVTFKALSSSENIWLPRDDLIKRVSRRRSRLSTPRRRSVSASCARSSARRSSSTTPTSVSRPSSSPTTPCAVSRAVRRSRSCSVPRRGVGRTSSSSTSRPTTSTASRWRR